MTHKLTCKGEQNLARKTLRGMEKNTQHSVFVVFVIFSFLCFLS